MKSLWRRRLGMLTSTLLHATLLVENRVLRSLTNPVLLKGKIITLNRPCRRHLISPFKEFGQQLDRDSKTDSSGALEPEFPEKGAISTESL